jgi:hypothetical protein
MSWFGTLPGTFRIPSMSSEKQISRVGMSEITSNARRIIVVRRTSPKVPIWGRPLGTIARFEQDMALFGRRVFIAFEQAARLFERPGLRGHRGIAQLGHRCHPSACVGPPWPGAHPHLLLRHGGVNKYPVRTAEGPPR